MPCCMLSVPLTAYAHIYRTHVYKACELNEREWLQAGEGGTGLSSSPDTRSKTHMTHARYVREPKALVVELLSG